MKILFSGYHNPHFITITEYIENAIIKLGHELYTFDDRQHIIPGRIRSYIKYLNHVNLKYLNKKLLSLALKIKPDIAIINGGHRITSNTLKLLANESICTVLWTTDVPINFQPILDSAQFYKYIFCLGTEAIQILKNSGIKCALWLPVGCDPVYHHKVDLSVEDQKKYSYDIVFVGSYSMSLT